MADPVLSPHDEAMAAKFDATQATAVQQATPSPIGQAPVAPQPAAVQRPEGVPEKFWDATNGVVMTDALLKSYTELESTRVKPEIPPAPPETPQVPPSKIDTASMAREFADTGALSEARYAELAASGVDKATVDSYIAGQLALATARDSEGFNLAGGKEAYTAMAAWAQANMSADDLAAFDSAVTGSPAQMRQAITALKSQYTAANGSIPQLNNGVPSGSGGETAFASRAEVTAAIRDSRYRADPAYRSMVERRIGLMEVF